MARLSVNMMRRDEAQAHGRVRYNTGTPCKRGHLSDRWTSNGGCVACGTRKVVKPTMTREVLTIAFPVSNRFDYDTRVILERALHLCAQDFHVKRGIEYPISGKVWTWSENMRKPISECPYL